MKKQWCITKITAIFIAIMERLLWLYNEPYNEDYPVLCFDERPCFLIGDKVAPIHCKVGQVAKEDYHYEKLGSCSLLMAIEPLSGKRYAKVYPTRKALDYADFLDFLAKEYPNAKAIRLVQDNLNTHDKSSFYKAFSPEKAFSLSQFYEFFFTPKHASWLNMAEIEFSAISKQCLNRRIPTMEEISKEVELIVKERNRDKVKIKWQFTINKARDTFSKYYDKLNVNKT